MLDKFILIGIGGSGGKTLRYTWRELDRRLKAAGWDDGMPEAWRFLHVDLPNATDVIEADVPADADIDYLGLGDTKLDYRDYDRRLLSAEEHLPAMVGWRPDPNGDHPAPHRGAGQRRAVGRVTVLTELAQIGAAIAREVAVLTAPGAVEQLASLNSHLGGSEPSATQVSKPKIIVISSLAGGSGSGAFLDVLEHIQRMSVATQLREELVTVLYTAELFEHLPAGMKVGTEPNSLAALSELLSAYDHEGEVSQTESAPHRAAGGVGQLAGRRVAVTNFFIGAKSENVTFTDSRDVYRSIGQALAALLTVGPVQEAFDKYLQANKSGTTTAESFLLAEPAASSRPASSIGFASVSLGNDLFAQYASERLAKQALDRLTAGHLEGVSREQRERRSDDALLAERIEAVKDSYFEAAGLAELGKDDNQIIDALRHGPTLGKELDEVVTKVRDDLGRLEAKPAEWNERLTVAFSSFGATFFASADAHFEQNALRWATDIQPRLAEATARYVGLYGLPTAIGLVDELSEQLLAAADELAHDAELRRGDEAGQTKRALQLLRTVRARVVGAGHQAVADNVKLRRKTLQRRAEGRYEDRTADLIRRFVAEVLPGLRQALVSARGALEQTLARADSALVASWSGHDVARHLLPAPNTLLLYPAAEFPGELDALLQGIFDGAAPQAAQAAALEEVITNGWDSIRVDDRPSDAQRLISTLQPWIPTLSEARQPGLAPAPALFRVEVEPRAVLRVATSWVAERRGALSDRVRQTLPAWLDANDPDAAARAQRFVDLMGQATKACAPLASLNAEAFHAVHGRPVPGASLLISPIPVADGHRAHDPVHDALVQGGATADDARRAFDPNAAVSSVELMSFLGQAVHPIVIDSVTKPIQAAWNAQTDKGMREQFWSFRRARPLPSFVPLSPARQQALVKGWFIARVLGQVGTLRGRWSESPLAVWSPTGSLRFPRYLLGVEHDSLGGTMEVNAHGQVLPALLETLPLAMVVFGNGESEQLRAYMRLIELGSVDQDLGVPHGALRRWIEHGTLEIADPGAPAPPVPPVAAAGTADDSSEARLAAVTTEIERIRAATHAKYSAMRVTIPTTLTIPRSWEIRDLLEVSLSQVLTDVREPLRRADDADVLAQTGPVEEV